MRRDRALVLFIVGLLLGSTLVVPVGAHVTNNAGHIWKQHVRKKVKRLFFTKAQANRRFQASTVSDLAAYCSTLATQASYAPCRATEGASLRTDAGADEFVGSDPSIAIGADGFPVIASVDGLQEELILIDCGDLACTRGHRSVTVLDSTTVDGETHIAIGPDGYPMIAYEDSFDLLVMGCDDPACASRSIVASDTTANVGIDSTVVFRPSGNPVIVHFDFTNRDLKIVNCDDPGCAGADESLVVDGDDPAREVGWGASAAVLPSGRPVMSYIDETNGTVKVAACHQASCQVIPELPQIGRFGRATVAGDAGLSSDTAIVVDGRDGYPVIAYTTTSNELRVVKCNDAACLGGNEAVATVDSSTLLGNVGIALGIDGNPVIAYRDLDGTPKLKVIHCNDPACDGRGDTPRIVEELSGTGRDPAIAIGSDGIPAIVHQRVHSSAHQLRLARPLV